MLVRPGDTVVGDDDGVVIVSKTEVFDTIRIAQEREEVEAVIKEQLKRYVLYKPSYDHQ